MGASTDIQILGKSGIAAAMRNRPLLFRERLFIRGIAPDFRSLVSPVTRATV
jgi:hypothetical protein